MIRVGPAGWSYADWDGAVYPRPRPRGFQPLRHLSHFVDLVEVNSTFYGFPDPASCESWARLVEDRPAFRFTAKIHQQFTHGEPSASEDLASLAGSYLAGIAPLARAGRLGALLAQFSIAFRCEPPSWQRIEELRALFWRQPLVLELRHASWFAPEALARLADLELSVAHIDLPAARDHPPAWHRATGRAGYLRLHGRNARAWFDRDAGRDRKYDYLYSSQELAELAESARRLAGEHDETFVVTNNHFSGKAVANALELKALLSGARVAAPTELVRAFPGLESCARAGGQGELF